MNILSLGNNQFLGVGKVAHNRQRQFNFVDSISVQKGSHAMKFGFDLRRLSPEFGIEQYAQVPVFSSVPQAESGKVPFALLFSSSNPTLLFRNLGVFAQDTWRIVPRLTVTYGLRWDVDFAPSSISGPNFNAVTGFNLSNLSNLALAPVGTPPFSTHYGNVAPRVGVAYQLSQSRDRQTVLRGGLGIFYDLASAEAGSIANGVIYPFGRSKSIVGAAFPLTPALAAPPPITQPTASNRQPLFGFDPDLQLPYTLQWNVALEQALGRQQTITAMYIGSVGRRLIQTASISSPNPNLAAAVLITNAATSNYNALQVQFQRRLSHGLQALASYTWSHSIDTASAGSVGSGSNTLVAALNANVNRGSSDFDIRHAVSVGLTYDVRVLKSSALANAILRGWSTENVVQARSAPPVNVFFNPFAFAQVINGFRTLVRPDVVPGQPFYLYGSQYPGGKALNPNAFAAPAAFPSGQGSLARNALRGFRAVQWDFAIHRDFPIHESLKLQFRAEMFNVLNHPNFGQPVGDLGSPSAANPQFGQSTQMLGQSLSGGNIGSGGFTPLYQIGGPRSVQFALKLFF